MSEAINSSRSPTRRSIFDEEPRKRRSRPELSRDIIVAAAITILDRDGEDQLSFRRLAAELGAGAASIYWYVPNREALLDLALDVVAGKVWEAIPPQSKMSTVADGWRSDLRKVAVEMYVGLGSRPWAGRQQLVSSDRGPNQLRIWDHLGRICLRAGLGEGDAFHAMSAVLSFVLGYVSQETAPTDPNVERKSYLEDTADFMASLDDSSYPAIRRLVTVFRDHDQRTQFDAGLELLLDGIELRVAQLPDSE